MSTEVYTESTCDRCRRVERRPGAEGKMPPVGWAVATIQWRAPGTGWSGGGRREEACLCPACADAVDTVMAREER